MTRLLLTIALLLSYQPFLAADESHIALVVGIDNYQVLSPLTTCHNDARGVADALVASGVYRSDAVVLLTGDAKEPQNVPTTATLRRRMSQVPALAGPEDTLLIYFSGHGITVDGEGYLVGSDGDADNAIKMSWLLDEVERSAARNKVLILDVCHAGSATKGVGGIAPSLQIRRKSVAVLLSCAAEQISYVDEAAGHSVFSARLIEALGGRGDRDADKRVTFEEVRAYVADSMRSWCLASGRTQTPEVVATDLEDFVIAAVAPEAPKPAAPATVSPLEAALAKGTRFSAVGTDAVRDEVTGLVWLLDDGGKKGTLAEAREYCAEMNRRLSGGSYWRLASKAELLELYAALGDYAGGARDRRVAPLMWAGHRYWSSTTAKFNRANQVSFSDGSGMLVGDADSGYFRLVRDAAR